MTAAAAFFYLFSTVMIGSAFMVIAARNPVHSVLFLILAFVNAAGLFLLLGAEFLAMIIVIVYVGAVAVLFLFVVMMLDVDFAELRQGFLSYLPLGALLGVVFLIELLLVIATLYVDPGALRASRPPADPDMLVTNTQARAISAIDPALPTNFGAQLILQGVRTNSGCFKRFEQLRPGHAVFFGHPADLTAYVLVIGKNAKLLLFFDAPQFLDLQMLIDQRAQCLALDLRHVFFGRLDPGGDDQQHDPLAQVIGRDDVVIDNRRHAFA
jgi:NADH:ubiquinone oxidoreductase subunit 6 (subunit J)